MLARRYLAIPTTSAPIESIFKKINRLGDEIVNYILCLRSWLHLKDEADDDEIEGLFRDDTPREAPKSRPIRALTILSSPIKAPSNRFQVLSDKRLLDDVIDDVTDDEDIESNQESLDLPDLEGLAEPKLGESEDLDDLGDIEGTLGSFDPLSQAPS